MKGGLKMEDKSVIDWIAYVLVVIGALNWALVGINSFSGVNYSWDLVAMLTGSIPILASIIYLLVGLSGIWVLIKLFK